VPVRPFRNELKFLLHYGTRELLLERWRRYLVRAPFTDEHAMSPILSQYYDSPDLRFYWEKLDGVGLRNKVRLRVYSHRFTPGQTAFLEIKHRYNDKVRKHRQKYDNFDPSLLDPGNWKFDDPQMESAFVALLERYRLRRSAQTYYQREAYEGAVESDVRVTFDTNLIGLHPGENLTRRVMLDRSRHLMPDTLVILEVKSTKGIPNWVHEGVVTFELQQKTIPKYISAVEVLRLPDLYTAGVYA
jgi:hypothetical protein